MGIKLKGLNESDRNAFIEVVAMIPDPEYYKKLKEVRVYRQNLEKRTYRNTRREDTPKLLNETAHKILMDLVQETLAKCTQINLGLKKGLSYYAPMEFIYQQIEAVDKQRIIARLDEIRVEARIPVIIKNTKPRRGRRLGWKPSHDIPRRRFP